MTITKIILFAKILAFASGDRTVTVTDLDKKMAADTLKRMADQRLDRAAAGTILVAGGCGGADEVSTWI